MVRLGATLPMVLVLGGCGVLKSGDGKLTNADFEAPETVKRGDVIEATASFRRGSNGKLLAYRWSLQAPPGSGAGLDVTNTQSVTFTADVLGDYKLTLVVDDGRTESAPVTEIVAAQNVPPSATMIAMPPRSAMLGEVIQLDATGSTDCDGDPLTYRWFFDHLPEGSNAEFSDPTGPTPTFIADQAGLFAPRVVAFDGIDEGEPHGVFIWAGDNSPPLAVAGDDRNAQVGNVVTLDGSASSDPDSADEILTYNWTMISQPNGSAAPLNGADQRVAELVPDVPGIYTIELVVTDELGLESLPDQVRITAR